RGIRLAPEKDFASIQEHNRKVDERLRSLNAELAKLTGKKGKPLDQKDQVEAQRLKSDIAHEQAKKKPVPPLVRGLADLDGKCPDGRVLKRGDYNRPGVVVTSAVPEVLAPVGYKLNIEPGIKTSGRRLALARWLTDPQHPLTARVQVNRVWAQHFGRG